MVFFYTFYNFSFLFYDSFRKYSHLNPVATELPKIIIYDLIMVQETIIHGDIDVTGLLFYTSRRVCNGWIFDVYL